MNCPICNKEYNEGEIFCKECGTPFTARQQAFNTFKPSKTIKPVSAIAYFWLLLLFFISPVNIIVFTILSFKKGININIRNFSRASVVIYILIYISLAVVYLFNFI